MYWERKDQWKSADSASRQFHIRLERGGGLARGHICVRASRDSLKNLKKLTTLHKKKWVERSRIANWGWDSDEWGGVGSEDAVVGFG